MPRNWPRCWSDPPPGLPPIRAAIAVHLYGQACELDPMLAACAEHGVALIEDCAQAHGATLHGRKLGTLGAASAFSLYPTKNLGALGDGGVLATDDFELADRIGAIRQYGWKERYISSMVGVNSRLDEIQAAILRVKLTALDAGNARRRAIAARYDAALDGGPLAPPVRRADAEHVFHQYVLRSPHRADFMARLKAEGVGTGIHYPVAGAPAIGLRGPRRPGPRRLRARPRGRRRRCSACRCIRNWRTSRSSGSAPRCGAWPADMPAARGHPRRAGALDGLASPRTLHAPTPARAAPPPRPRRLRRRGDPDRRRGHGPSPKLPPPHQGLIPTINIAPARGWAEGATPKPGDGLRVAAFAEGLDHPRQLLVLPNGDVLVAETNGPKRPEDGKGIRGWVQGNVQGLGRRQDRQRQPHHPAARRRP